MASDKKRLMRFYIILLTVIIFIFWLYFFKSDLVRQSDNSDHQNLEQIFSGFFSQVQGNLKEVNLKQELNLEDGRSASLSPEQLDYLVNQLKDKVDNQASSTTASSTTSVNK
jgi:hypothetical protein